MKPRVLLAAWDGGAGHIRRTVSLADRLALRGCTIAHVASGAGMKALRILAPGTETFLSDSRPATAAPRESTPRYSHAFRHDQRRRALGFTAQFMRDSVENLRGIIREFRPNFIIADYHDTMRIAADVEGVPYAGIAMATGIPDGLDLGFWKALELGRRELPSCLDVYNTVRSELSLGPYSDERDPFVGSLTLIPSCRILDPAPESSDVLFVGPISGPSRIERRPNDARPVVVSYLAEGNARPVDIYTRRLRQTVAKLADQCEFRIYGDNRYERDFGQAAPDGVFRGLVSIEEFEAALCQASVLITAGGAALAHALRLGVPALCLPWTSSESAWAWHLQQAGAGMLPAPYFAPLEWRFDEAVGCYVAGHWEINYSSEELAEWILELVVHESFISSAEHIASELEQESESLSGIVETTLTQLM